MARPRGFDEEEVLRAARDAFWQRGYAATSTADLLEATGLGKSSLYAAFGDKRSLFLRILDGYDADALEGVRSVLAGPDEGAVDRLRAFLHSAAGTGRAAKATAARGCLLARSTAESGPEDDDVRERAQRTYGTMEELLEEAVRQAQRAGELSVDSDPAAQARLLLATHRGLEALGRSGTPPSTLREIGDSVIDAMPR